MNFFKEAEHVLRNRPKLDLALGNLRIRHDRLISCDTGIQENALELAVVIGCIKETELKIKEIDGVLTQVTGEHRTLIRKWYFESKTKEVIMEELNIGGVTSLYRQKNNAVSCFTMLYFGAAGLNY